MAVYVDDVRHQFGRMVMCHLWADTLDELLAMVDAIGVQRKWIQGHATLSRGKARHASWVHFDICMTKKKQAIHHGARLTDELGPLEHVARLRMKHADPRVQEIGRKGLARVLEASERRAAE